MTNFIEYILLSYIDDYESENGLIQAEKDEN